MKDFNAWNKVLSVKKFLLRLCCELCLDSAGVTERSHPRWPHKHHYSGMQAKQQREAEADPGFQKVSCFRRGSGWAAPVQEVQLRNIQVKLCPSAADWWNTPEDFHLWLPGHTPLWANTKTVCFSVCVQLNFIYRSSFTKRFTATEHRNYRRGELKQGWKDKRSMLKPEKSISKWNKPFQTRLYEWISSLIS